MFTHKQQRILKLFNNKMKKKIIICVNNNGNNGKKGPLQNLKANFCMYLRSPYICM